MGSIHLHMLVVESESKDSWKWFLDCLGRAKSNILLNNMCEVQNRHLQDGRDLTKPLLSLYMQKIFKLIVRAAAKLKVEWKGSDFVLKKWELSGIPAPTCIASIWDQANNGIRLGIPSHNVFQFIG
ncbi:hypothetical protein Tco_0911060 [Tanacetum coccineum]|uniref:Transposase n=1 Tax=Tanacetum coccineum TaxID=301880 RepID=A0ABQ5CUP7_9ASTR